MTEPPNVRAAPQDNTSSNAVNEARPSDGFLAEVSRRAALTAHQQKAGENTMVGRTQTPDDRWRSRAACRTADPEMFFPVAENGPEHDQAVAEAKQVCAACPVVAECATWAVEALPHGVAGGMSADERHHARQAQRPRRAPAPRTVATTRIVTLQRPSRTRSRRIEDGQAAISRGVGRDQVAAEFGVTRRTVDRWAADRTQAGAASMTGGAR